MADVAQITVESSDSTAFAEGAITITKPTGLALDDLMVLVLSFSINNTVTTPSGWTVDTNTSTTWGGIDIDVATFYKVADAGDVAASNFSFDVADTTGDLSGCIIRISGENTDNTIGNSDIGSDSSTGTSRSHTLSLTPAQSDSLLIAVMGIGNDTTTSSPSSTGSPIWTEVLDEGRASAADAVWVGYAPYPSQTEITNFSATTVASTTRSDVYMFEVRSRVDASGTNTLLSVSPTTFTQTGSAGATGTTTLLEVSPETFTQSGEGIAPTVWTPINKS